jgi:hypothetical protein
MSNEMTTDNMSNEEVIETLKGIVFNGFDRTTRKERQALDLAIRVLTEKPQGEFVKMLNERIEQGVCKWCQMNKHCELCEISRVFMIISLTDEEMKGGDKNEINN